MTLPLPALVLTPALVPFAVIAVAMIGVTIFLLGTILPSNGRPPLLTQMVIALAVIGGGSLLLLSLLYVFLSPDGTDAWTWVLLAFNFMMMFPAGIWFVAQILFRDRRVDAVGWFWPVTLSVVATASEALMGVLFAYAAAGGPTAPVPAIAVGLSSVWFFWSMAAVMAALLAWAPLGNTERSALLALTTAAVLGPWVTTFPLVGGVAMAVLMGAIFVVLVRALLTHRVVAEEGGLLVGLAVAFLAMALAGMAVASSGGSVASVLAFGAVMGGVMGVEVAYLIRRYYRGRMERPWIARASDDADEEPAGSEAKLPSVLASHSTDRPAVGR